MDNEEKFSIFRASVTEKGAPGTIAGTAVLYNVEVERGFDLYEKVMPGAFKAQLNAANRIPVLWQHMRESPIGRAVKLQDSSSSLDFQALISQNDDIPDAKKALALLREGIIDEISVGFEWVQWHEERDQDKMVIVHTKSRLKELSVVTAGALGRGARVMTVNSEGTSIDITVIRARLAKLNS